MTKKVTIIIPTKNSERTIENCLRSIKDQSYKYIEIIVVDNNSSDKTTELAKKYTKLVFNKGPERSAQRNFGAKKSRGEYLLFIDSDMELSKNVIADSINESAKYSVLIIPEESRGDGFWAKCKTLERSFYVGVDYIEAARFFDKKIFNSVGGYDEGLISGEDWDLSQRVIAKNSVGRINSYIFHDEGKLKLIDDVRKKFYYSRNIKKYKTNNKSSFAMQSSPLKRYKLFFSKPKKLFENPVVGIGMLFMKTAEFGAGTVGYIVG
jgi:glycosyltransferase involved in cell wall biosynthesis